jgi:Schlafen, AlbA_2
VWTFSKRVDDLTAGDLAALVSAGAVETVALEFKREAYGHGDEATREMLRDITSMANAEGGVIVIGIDEDDEGAATALTAVVNGDAEAARIVSSCVDNITDRIPGFRARPVPFGTGHLILVYIPRSYRRPHMITFKGATDFWIRHDRQKSRMSITEIRAAVTTTQELGMKVEQFVEQRRQLVMELRPQPIFGLMATPLLLEEGRVDISEPGLSELLKDPPAVRQLGGSVRLAYAHAAQVIPTVRGLAALEEDKQVLEVFRSGHVEFLVFPQGRSRLADMGPKRRIHNWAIAVLVASFARLIDELRTLTGLADPYLLTLSLWDWHKFTMARLVVDLFGRGDIREWTEGANILLPPVLQSLDDTPDQSAKRILDHLWNAFHFMHCPFFNQSGEFLIPQGFNYAG